MTEDVGDTLIRIGQQARMIETISTSRKARQLAKVAVKHATGGLQYYTDKKLDGANRHASEAAKNLTDAAKLHVATLQRTGDTPSPEILDVSHLGSAHADAESVASQLTEEKKNGS